MIKLKSSTTVLMCCLALLGSAVAQSPVNTISVINAEGAAAGIQGCLDLATERGWQMSIWVFDATGEPVAFHRMDGATFYSIESSRLKAYTSSQEVRPSGDYAGFPSHSVLEMLTIFPVPGGYPVMINGQIVGAVGTGGEGGGADEECAIAAADAILAAAGEEPWRMPQVLGEQ